MGHFYKAIVQAVLLYGSESWTLLESMLNRIKSFHSRVARYICGKHIRQLPDETWEYPATEEVLRDAGLFPVAEYIRRRRETAWSYIAGRPIFEKCLGSQCKERNTKRILWWNLETAPQILEMPGLSFSSDSDF